NKPQLVTREVRFEKRCASLNSVVARMRRCSNDKWKHCIFVFNHKGELVYRMCNKGYGKSELCSPEGITFHPERSVLYVADTGNDRIQILEKDGTYLDSIGPKNKNIRDTVRFRKTGPSKLNQPTDVAVTIMHVVVADSEFRIKYSNMSCLLRYLTSKHNERIITSLMMEQPSQSSNRNIQYLHKI
ncbi:Tripartite motif-containing protein 2, partial [Trachymyrmex septentrionalis]